MKRTTLEELNKIPINEEDLQEIAESKRSLGKASTIITAGETRGPTK
ncbi:hypothetical protein [Cognataquiflexum aquatile]|nr:hypothetical protein [Cognataquiflexum aquatile]